MANHDQGAVSFVYSGRRYTLKHNPMVWAEAQDVLARGGRKPEDIDAVQRKFLEGREKYAWAVFYGLLQAHHPEIETLDQAITLLQDAGQAAVDAMLQAFNVSKPDPADVKELNEGTNPPQAQAKKTRKRGGATSISKLAATA